MIFWFMFGFAIWVTLLIPILSAMTAAKNGERKVGEIYEAHLKYLEDLRNAENH